MVWCRYLPRGISDVATEGCVLPREPVLWSRKAVGAQRDLVWIWVLCALRELAAWPEKLS